MRILMFGNSFTYTNDMPEMLAKIIGADVVQHTRGDIKLGDQLDQGTDFGKEALSLLDNESWNYVILQEMSRLPVTSKDAFLNSVDLLCDEIRDAGAVPVLFATWAYKEGNKHYEELGISYKEMVHSLHDAYQEAADLNRALIADVGQNFYRVEKSRNCTLRTGFIRMKTAPAWRQK